MAKKSIYASVPKAAKKRISSTNPMGSIALGSAKPPSVPQGSSGLHGLDVTPHTFRTPSIKGAHKYGNVAKLQRGGSKVSSGSVAPKVGKKAKYP